MYQSKLTLDSALDIHQMELSGVVMQNSIKYYYHLCFCYSLKKKAILSRKETLLVVALTDEREYSLHTMGTS